MSRARRRDNSISDSLLPFLAVLLSTMGVLVVLLVVMASVQIDQAKSKHQTELAEKRALANSPEQQRLRKELANAERLQRRGQAVRDEANRKLAHADTRLGQIEADIRRRQERLGILAEKIRELNSKRAGVEDDSQMADDRLTQLKQRMAERQQEIEDLRQQVANRPKSYALIPYQGDRGTRLQPIYIECRSDAIIFQPEGVKITAEDMNRALREGNPLSASIRAVQRFYFNRGTGVDEKPYPLFLIRPDAAGTWEAVLSALEHTECEYGYEQVGKDWQLDYSAANPLLAREIVGAIENSSLRLAHLKQRAPGQYEAGRRVDFSPQPNIVSLYDAGKLPPNVVVTGGSGATGRLARSQASEIDGIEVATLAAAFQRASQASEAPVGGQGGSGSTADFSPGTDDAGRLKGEGVSRYGSAPEDVDSQAAGASLASNQAGAATKGAMGGSAQDAPQQANNEEQQQAAVSALVDSGSRGPSRAADKQSGGFSVERTLRVTVTDQSIQVGVGEGMTTVPISSNFADTANELHKALKGQVLDWGIAGDGASWKPTLKVVVGPGGEHYAKAIAEIFSARGVPTRISKTPTNRL